MQPSSYYYCIWQFHAKYIVITRILIILYFSHTSIALKLLLGFFSRSTNNYVLEMGCAQGSAVSTFDLEILKVKVKVTQKVKNTFCPISSPHGKIQVSR